ncbi:MAG TPA: hypothetical protein VEM95_00400 [Thermoplasmata archaeon]|nr:hypothetical protein [Thermoplasmata archaeon]
MDRVLRGACVAAVLGLAIPPAREVALIAQDGQRGLAAALLVLGVVAGLYAAIRRWPLAARATTVAYGAFGVGLGLFASNWTIASLIAYVVGLIGMNLLLHHVAAYGPVLAAFQEEDAIARRARAVVLKSLAMSGLVLAVTFGGSLALVPFFAFDVGLSDPLTALALAATLLIFLLLLAVLPVTPRLPKRRSEVRAPPRTFL